MRRLGNLVLLSLFLVGFAASPARAGWNPELARRAQETIARFTQADPTLNTFFEKAYGYAVFPRVGKGAVGIGGAYGTGVVYERSAEKSAKNADKSAERKETRWEPVGTASLMQFTLGVQLGGQAYSEVIFFEDKATLDRFKKGNYEMSAQASAVAADKGAAANTDYSSGVAIFTLVKGGLMFEASVGGQKFTFEPKDNVMAEGKAPGSGY